jgi:hypothetical protein
MARKRYIVINPWSTILIIFFTMIGLSVFRPDVYSSILIGLLQVIELIGGAVPEIPSSF